jgi:hypothetical protein
MAKAGMASKRQALKIAEGIDGGMGAGRALKEIAEGI